MRFTDLKKGSGSTIIEEEQLHELFHAVVMQCRLRLWKPGDPIAMRRRLLVGIRLLSDENLSLLDVLDEGCGERGKHAPSTDVFNFEDVSHIDSFIPGFSRAKELGVIIKAPIVGFWTNGELRDKAWGQRAVEMLESVFSMNLRWNTSAGRWDVHWHALIY
jgi:hypothetical protein